MTAPPVQIRQATERLIVVALLGIILLSVILVAVLNPGLMRFWPMSTGEFLQTIAPLFLVSLFIERALEVFLTTWRGPEAAQHQLRATSARAAAAEAKAVAAAPLAEEETLVAYKATTQRIAFLSGVTIGVIVSALGVRALGLFVDPAAYRALPAIQREWFDAADVFLTGAVLGGGSDGLHKLISVFTDFLDQTSARFKK